MKDERFEWAQRASLPPRKIESIELDEAGRQLLLVPSIQRVLSSWWSAVRIKGVLRGKGISFEGPLVSQAKTSGKADPQLAAFLKQADSFLTEERGQLPNELRVVGFVLSNFLAQALVREKRIERGFFLAVDIIARSYEAKITLYTQLATKIRGDAALAKKWVDALWPFPMQDGKLLEPLRFVENELQAAEEREKRFRESQDPLGLIDTHRGHLMLERSLRRRLQFLLMLEPELLPKVLEAIPVQAAREAFVDDLQIVRDRSLIERAIDVAEVAFDKSGAWTGCVGALMVVDLALRHAKELESTVEHASRLGHHLKAEGSISERAKSELTKLRGQELPAWLVSISDRIESRQDGAMLLAYQLAAINRSSRFARFASNRPQEAWRAEFVASEAFVKKLASSAMSVDELIKIPDSIREKSRGYEMMFLLAAIDVQEMRPKSSDALAQLWSKYESLLVSGDREIVSEGSRQNGAEPWVFSTLGGVLAGFDEPCVAFSATWAKLYPLRRRARMSYEFGLEEPGQHLIKTAFGALNRQSFPGGSSAGLELWRAAKTASWSGYFEANDRDGRNGEGVASCYAFLPFLFRQADRADIQSILAEDKELFTTHPKISALAAYFLQANGIEGKRVFEGFSEAGIDLKEQLDALEEWEKLTATKRASALSTPIIRARLGI